MASPVRIGPHRVRQQRECSRNLLRAQVAGVAGYAPTRISRQRIFGWQSQFDGDVARASGRQRSA
jgi:hypothetical protein